MCNVSVLLVRVVVKYYQLKQIYDYKWSEMVGEITKTEEPKEMDLIEISPGAVPPVAKIMDYGKFQYDQKKKIKAQKAKAHNVEVKSIQVKIGTDGKVCINTHAASDIVVDVTGYIPAGSLFSTVVPGRLLDTRSVPNYLTIDGLFQGNGRRDRVTRISVAMNEVAARFNDFDDFRADRHGGDG